MNIGYISTEIIKMCKDSEGRNITCPVEYPPQPREPRGKGQKPERYWLVPPFLIGASSVVIVYVIVNCFYIHCYAKKKLQCLVAQPPQGIVIGELTLTMNFHPSHPFYHCMSLS